MTLDKAKALLKVQTNFAGPYNRHSTKLILQEVEKEHGRKAVDDLIVELKLNEVFDFEVGKEL